MTQPDAGTSNLHEFLVALLADSDISRVVAVTAWVNHRGLSRLVPNLRAFRTRGTAEIILGIDEGGATEQGLRLAAVEFDRASVFFTTEERTFHPKLYLGTGTTKALLFLGSNNLTPGGLFFNFEAAIAVELDLGPGGPPEDRDLTTAAEMYIARLEADADVCKPLLANLESIIRDPTYRVRDEAAPRARRGTSVIDPDADREDLNRTALFGRSSQVLKGRVPPGEPIPASSLAGATGAGPRSVRRRRTAGATAGPSTAAPARGGGSAVIRRWFRPLDRTAAQHPPKSEQQSNRKHSAHPSGTNKRDRPDLLLPNGVLLRLHLDRIG